jgi:hypothetical protein
MLVRGAVALGRTLGSWRRRSVAAAQDAYVEAWQAAWMEGCSAGWAGQPVTALPYRGTPQRDAWAAGWNWAQTQPDRRSQSRPALHGVPVRRINAERRRDMMTAAAKGGALSLTVLAAARWLIRMRGRAQQPATNGRR